MSNPLTPVPTISLLEPPAQTITNSVTLSPPKTTCVSASDELLVTEPRASVSVVNSSSMTSPCNVVLTDCVQKFTSPVGHRTRAKLISKILEQGSASPSLAQNSRLPNVSSARPVPLKNPECTVSEHIPMPDNSDSTCAVPSELRTPSPVTPPPRELSLDELLVLQNMKTEKVSGDSVPSALFVPAVDSSSQPDACLPDNPHPSAPSASLSSAADVPPVSNSSDQFPPLSPELQLALTPSPASPPALRLEVDATPAKLSEVLYYPDSLRCSYCEAVLSSPRSFYEHVREFSHFEIPPSPVSSTSVCFRCNTDFNSKSALRSHNCNNPKPVIEKMRKCPWCVYIAKNDSDLGAHFSQFHPWLYSPPRSSSSVSAPACPPSSDVLCVTTPDVDDPPSGFQCLICEEVLPSETSLSQHSCPSRPPSPQVSVKCDSCENIFSSETLLLQHDCANKCNESSRFFCPKCKFSAPTFNILELHNAQHHSPVFSSSVPSQNPASLHCPFCKDAFSSDVDLQAHNCTSIKRFILPPSPGPVRNCAFCSFAVIDEATLQKHLLDRHSCKICDFKETFEVKLKTHTRDCHTCKVCSFSERPNLRLHDHTKEVHSCNLCSFVEKKRNGLRFHFKSKHGRWAPNAKSAARDLSAVLSANKKPTIVGLSSPISAEAVTCSSSSTGINGSSASPQSGSSHALFCLGCAAEFSSIPLLEDHSTSCESYHSVLRAAIPDRRPLFRCSKCSFVGKDQSSLDTHHQSSHPPPAPLPDGASTLSFNVDFNHPSQSSQLPPPSAYSVPPASFRDGNSLNIVFPIVGKVLCTEEGCTADYYSPKWTIMKNNLIKHLLRHHKVKIFTSNFWCSVCEQKTGSRPSAHPCFANAPLSTPPPTPLQWPCQECGMSFTSETGLNNHVRDHKMKAILASGVQRSITVPKPPRRRVNVNASIPAEERDVADQNISDPLRTIAQLPSLPDTPPLSPDDEEEGLLAPFTRDLEKLLESDPSADAFSYFCTTIDMALAEVYSASATGPPSAAVASYGSSSGSSSQRREIDILDPKTVQTLYNKNRPRAIREITKKSGRFCDIPPATVEEYFRQAWQPNQAEEGFFPPSNISRVDVLDSPFTPSEVSKKLKKAENTAAGPDRITYMHWRSMVAAPRFLSVVFNLCLLFRRVPPAWKSSTTILIPKSGDASLPQNWRPIALSSTIYKMFTKCLAARLGDWCEKYNVLSINQKGFTPYDGVVEHNFVLQQRLLLARSRGKEICIAWLDVTNAFGAIPHGAIFEALAAINTGSVFIDIIKDIYCDSATKILTNEGPTNEIPLLSGVKQGCPISGLLFDICIDPIVRTLQGDHPVHKTLAYADDVCIIAESPSELQHQLNIAFSEFSKLGLQLNPGKSTTLHVSGAAPVGSRPTQFFINDVAIKYIEEGDFHRFLGKPVGFNACPDYANLKDLSDLASHIISSKLAIWQKIDALKCFFYPSLQFALRTGQYKKEDWAELDRVIRRGLKAILNLPSNAANNILYGARKMGSFAIPIAAEDSDLYRVDTAFKLLTSKDDQVAALALLELNAVVSARFGIPSPSDQDLEKYLNGDQYRERDNAHSSIWTITRLASFRQGISWQFDEGVPRIKFDDLTLRSSDRRRILHSLRLKLQVRRSKALIEMPNQGKVMECVAQSTASSHFLTDGKFTRFCDFKFIIPARLNLLPLKGAQTWRPASEKLCNKCNKGELETLPHVLNHCPSRSRGWQLTMLLSDRIVKLCPLEANSSPNQPACLVRSDLR
ncbi:Retrovirus-related Pol polyprotein from type-1 retrotransposable element R2 [Araneus ventricosus]|uniref:Retrovirus-related Pol polyprotein from type-1 retrotransposable element R2 n=1 Tax=Araneus ventricosus TaxID=182803 RepID=A0A4Y2N276_ARAVE|nr:Retrovirus-related Pol polyprotein from type-1 retrotransposable element R2 [Araneus ventricosus]